jgi:hypothetical protein
VTPGGAQHDDARLHLAREPVQAARSGRRAGRAREDVEVRRAAAQRIRPAGEEALGLPPQECLEVA